MKRIKIWPAIRGSLFNHRAQSLPRLAFGVLRLIVQSMSQAVASGPLDHIAIQMRALRLNDLQPLAIQSAPQAAQFVFQLDPPRMIRRETAQTHMKDLKLSPEQICFIGDDLTDLPVIRQVGLGVAVADAAAEVRAAAHHVTTLCGGQGAVRELIETLLKQKQRWDDLIRKYVGP